MEKQPSVDKAYVKKHKINDLLNDLYIAITKDKPEHPIEYAISLLELKLPPKELPKPQVVETNERSLALPGLLSKGNFQNLLKRTKSVDKSTIDKSASKIEELLRGVSNEPSNANASLNQSNASAKSEFVSPFRQLQIIDKLHHVMIHDKYALTEEEILKNEEINAFTRKYEDDEQIREVNSESIKKLLTSKREIDEHNKKGFVRLLEEEKQKERVGQHSDQIIPEDTRRQPVEERSKDVELALLEEMGSTVNVKKTKQKKATIKNYKSYDPTNQDIQLVICKICGTRVNPNEEFAMYASLPAQRLSVPYSSDTRGINILGQTVRTQASAANESLKQIKEVTPAAIVSNNEKDVNKTQDGITLKSEAIEDDMLESASQVSGPRGPISIYEADTYRSMLPQRIDFDPNNNGSNTSVGVLAWVLARQTKNSIPNSEPANNQELDRFYEQSFNKFEKPNSVVSKSENQPLWRRTADATDTENE